VTSRCGVHRVVPRKPGRSWRRWLTASLVAAAVLLVLGPRVLLLAMHPHTELTLGRTRVLARYRTIGGKNPGGLFEAKAFAVYPHQGTVRVWQLRLGRGMWYVTAGPA